MLTKTALALVALAAVGCAGETQGQPPAPVDAVAPPAPEPTTLHPCTEWEIQVDSRLDPSWPAEIAAAADEWDEALQGTFKHHLVVTSTPQPYSQPKACVLAVEADARLPEEEDGAVGFADQTMVDPATGEKFGHIRLTPEARPAGGGRDLAVHEMGHFVGLPHSTDPSSVMHVPLPQPACITDDDAVNACSQWGLCPQPAKRAGRCATERFAFLER